MGLSIVAFLASGFAVCYARQEATAVRSANAPVVVGGLTSPGVNQSAGPCTISITFDGKQEIDKAVLSISSCSGLDRISPPGATEATAAKIRLDDITSGSPIEFPGDASDFNTGRLRVVMRGTGLGKIGGKVNVENHSIHVY